MTTTPDSSLIMNREVSSVEGRWEDEKAEKKKKKR
jgi:hypothetical protein